MSIDQSSYEPPALAIVGSLHDVTQGGTEENNETLNVAQSFPPVGQLS